MKNAKKNTTEWSENRLENITEQLLSLLTDKETK
jgi:hypothetical protein